MKKCLLTIPKYDVFGSIIFLAFTLLTFLAMATLDNQASNMIFLVSANISTFTLTTLSIITLKTNYHNQGTIKRSIQYFTTILFSLISIFLLILWILWILGRSGFLSIAIFGGLSMALTGAITLLWTLTHLATCLLHRR